MIFLTKPTGPSASLFASGPGPAGWNLSQRRQASHCLGQKFCKYPVLINANGLALQGEIIEGMIFVPLHSTAGHT